MRKTNLVAFRCSETERRALERVADSRGQNLSEVLRTAVREEARRSGVRVTATKREVTHVSE